ncbi:hypothetical protein [Variovorax sp.]|uniref:hypothetical protein n=1 Tax=Variovorax sp. TaxID=1871043 RepID=UPI0037DA4CD8
MLFSRLDQAVRGSYQNLDEYLATKEQPAQERIQAHRQALHLVNAQLADLERQSGQAHENELKEKLASKKLDLGDLQAKKPAEVAKPTDDAGTAPTAEGKRLGVIAEELGQLEADLTEAEATRRALLERSTVLTRVVERLQQFEQQAARTNEGLVAELQQVQITFQRVLAVETQRPVLLDLVNGTEAELSIRSTQWKQLVDAR